MSSEEKLTTVRKTIDDHTWLIGTKWLHRKGERVYVLGLAILEASLEPAVLYYVIPVGSPGRTYHWSRPLTEFLDGRFTREVQT